MPVLKQLDCRITVGRDFGLSEHGTRYGDGFVETFATVPNEPTAFAIRLKSVGYIAPGLGMFVYMDGVYQCNRRRFGLRRPTSDKDMNETDIEFCVRQKEIKQSYGKFIGREWKFEKFHTVPAGQASTEQVDAFTNLGTIEVVVLRCQPNEDFMSAESLPGQLEQQRSPIHCLARSEVGDVDQLFNGTNDDTNETDLPYYLRVDGGDEESDPPRRPRGVENAFSEKSHRYYDDDWNRGRRPHDKDSSLTHNHVHEAHSDSKRRDRCGTGDQYQSNGDGWHKWYSKPNHQTHKPFWEQNQPSERRYAGRYSAYRSRTEPYDATRAADSVRQNAWNDSSEASSTSKSEESSSSSSSKALSRQKRHDRHHKSTRRAGSKDPKRQDQRDRYCHDYDKVTPSKTRRYRRHSKHSKREMKRGAGTSSASNRAHENAWYGSPSPKASNRSISRCSPNRGWNDGNNSWANPADQPGDGNWGQFAAKNDNVAAWHNVNANQNTNDGWGTAAKDNHVPVPGRAEAQNAWHTSANEATGMRSGRNAWDDKGHGMPNQDVQGDRGNQHGSLNQNWQEASHQAGQTSPVEKIKLYWKALGQKHTGTSTFSPDSVFVVEEEPLLKVPELIAQKHGLEYQVRAGPGALYSHRMGKPVYLDTLESPYAVFRFKYRSRQAIERLLGTSIPAETREEHRARMLSLSKEEMYDVLMKQISQVNEAKDTNEQTGIAQTGAWESPANASNGNSNQKPGNGQIGAWGAPAAQNNDDSNQKQGNGQTGNAWDTQSVNKQGWVGNDAGGGGW